MDCLTDFFSKLQIEDSYLAKYFKEVFIKKIVYYKEEKRIYLYLVSKKIVQNDKISLLEKSLLDALPYFNSVKVKIHYTGYDRASNSDIIKKYWNNILNILISICPPLNGWKKEIEYMCVEDNLKIKIPKPFFYDRLIAKDAINSIKNILNEELGLDLNITLEKAIDSKVDTE
ncbi:MAG: hypothetical protein LBR30_05395 [Clostridioides sp.]|jgi:DNA polymerase-3 subunit alpha (Gram-positive type)|nr:hypothetical protein [Clostridioides sp.]